MSTPSPTLLRSDPPWHGRGRTGYEPLADAGKLGFTRKLVRADGNDLSGFAFQAVALDKPTAAPLAVAVMEPKDESRVTAERATLTGKVIGGTGGLRITVTLNGAEIARRQESSAPGKDVPLSVPLKLAPGKNTLIVTVTDGSGVSRDTSFNSPA